MVEANTKTMLVKMELLLGEYDHIEVCSTICYLTAVNESSKEIFDKIKRVYGEGFEYDSNGGLEILVLW